jgi:hypothetical protein
LLATTHVPKELQTLQQQPISVNKLINLFYNLTPSTRAGAIDRHIKYIAHILQSFLATEGADLEKQLPELQTHTKAFCSKIQNSKDKMSDTTGTLLKMMEFAVMSF